MSDTGAVAVVIPAFNEAATIRDVVSRALAVCSRVIVSDDGSTDGTTEQLIGLDVTLIRHGSNRRKAAAIRTGMRAALDSGAAAVITLDADGQRRPEDIPALMGTAAEHPGSIIIGARLQEREQIPAVRYRANRVANFWISWAAGYPIRDSQSGFRLYPAELLEDLDLPTRPRPSWSMHDRK